MIPQEELNRLAKIFNEQLKYAEIARISEDAKEHFLGVLNVYLFLAKQNNVADNNYNVIKKALQDITNWFTIGLDIETMGQSKTVTPASKDHVLLEI